MKKDLHYILLCIVMLLLQTVINNHVYTNPLVFICFIPLLIIQMPLLLRPYVALPAAFTIGLLADILSGGVIGLNAGAAVLATTFRRPLFYLCFSKGTILRDTMPAVKEVGFYNYSLYAFLVILIYFLFYVFFDGFSAAQWKVMAIRLGANSLINLVLIMIISISFFNTDKR